MRFLHFIYTCTVIYFCNILKNYSHYIIARAVHNITHTRTKYGFGPVSLWLHFVFPWGGSNL